MECPCQSLKKYNDCCERYHDGNLLPATAEELSRARHSASALNYPQYLYDTWDKSMRLEIHEINLLLTHNFIDFKVIEKDMGLENHDVGMVTFETTYDNGFGHITNKVRGFYKRVNSKWIFYRSENLE